MSAVAATSGPAGYIIVGKLVAPGGGCVADVWWSPNLTSWTRAHDVNDTTGSSQVLAVAAGAPGFVSVGSHDGKPAVWTTANGSSWETIVLPVPDGAATAVFQQVAINGNRVVALGQAMPAAGTEQFQECERGPVRSSSPVNGGASWRPGPFSSPGPDTTFTALTAASSAGFTAAGMFGQPGQQDVALWTCGDGRELEAVGVQQPQRIRNLADRRAGPGRYRGHRHRHHRHPAKSANRHLHPPARSVKEIAMCPTDLDLDLPEIAEDEQAPPALTPT